MLSARLSPLFSADPALFGGWRLGLMLLLLALIKAQSAELGPVVATIPAAAANTPIVVPEYNAKAGYLLTFTRYVEWPEGHFATPTDPVVIGVLGTNPFGDVLERTVQGMKSQGRPIEIRYVKTADEAAQCQMVFIARRQERDEAAWLSALRGRPVLTVTESEQGLAWGAVLSLTLEKAPRGTKVAFSASLPASREAGLQISASMLASAKKVYREPFETKETP